MVPKVKLNIIFNISRKKFKIKLFILNIFSLFLLTLMLQRPSKRLFLFIFQVFNKNLNKKIKIKTRYLKRMSLKNN